MGETAPFRRTWRVTLLRLAVVAAVIALAAMTFYVGAVAEMHRMQDPHAFTYGRALAIVAIAPLLWLIPWGAAADHFVSEFGPLPALLLHLAGIHIASVVVTLGLGIGFARNFPPLGEPYATLGFASIAVWILLGFAAAGLVPGSFPSRRQRSRRGLPGKSSPPADAARVKDSRDAH